jgi:putative membrane protein
MINTRHSFASLAASIALAAGFAATRANAGAVNTSGNACKRPADRQSRRRRADRNSPAAAGQNAPGNTGAMSAKPGAATLSSSDRSFLKKAAEGGLAEVELGQLASQRASDPQVKQFAQRMVADHGKANDQLKQIASSKNVELPTALPAAAKRERDRLSKLSGAQFDREYMSHMTSDHKKDTSLFRSAAKSAKDSDVRQFASATLPTLEEHLQMSQSISKSAKSSAKTSS